MTPFNATITGELFSKLIGGLFLSPRFNKLGGLISFPEAAEMKDWYEL